MTSTLHSTTLRFTGRTPVFAMGWCVDGTIGGQFVRQGEIRLPSPEGLDAISSKNTYQAKAHLPNPLRASSS